MTRIGTIAGLLVAAATLARAQDEALAKAAVNRARESLQAFDGAELEREVDVDAKRARFVRDLDDALAEVVLLPPGPARDIGGHSLNRIAIDALFARGLATAGLNRRVDLISLDDVCARLDRAVLGEEAGAVERAVRRVHTAAVRWRPGSWRVQPDYAPALAASLDEATQAIRALLPAQRRYAQLLGSRLTAAVREWRRKTLLVEEASGHRDLPLGSVGTVVDKAWLDARLPPFITQRSQLLDSAGHLDGRDIVWKVYSRRPTLPGVRAEVELVAPDGRLLARTVGAEFDSLRLQVPPGTPREGNVLLATLTDPDGTVHTTATILGPAWFPEAEGPSRTAGLVGGVAR